LANTAKSIAAELSGVHEALLTKPSNTKQQDFIITKSSTDRPILGMLMARRRTCFRLEAVTELLTVQSGWIIHRCNSKKIRRFNDGRGLNPPNPSLGTPVRFLSNQIGQYSGSQC